MRLSVELNTVYEDAIFTIKEFKPSFHKLFYIEMESLTILKKIRFWIDLLYGYSVYYLYVDGQAIGYCTITSGKNPRYSFATANDVMIGPYFIMEGYRGRGYAKTLVQLVITKCKTDWERCFLYIKNENIPSIHVANSIGANLLFHAHNTRLRQLVKKEDGEFGIYILQNPRSNI